jgi:tetratricopeptide (TPR) repeat protein
MRVDLGDAKREFRRLIAEDFTSTRILDLLLRLRENIDLTPDDTGWALWSICDRYALAEDAGTQHGYQSEFRELVSANFPERAHWVVCDSTQAMTLIGGGFTDFWWGCYRSANDSAPRVAENRTVRFEAHRANASAYTRFGELERAESALDAMAGLLDEDPRWRNREFAVVTYSTLLVEFHTATGQTDKVDETGRNLERMLDDWLERVGDPRPLAPEEKPLLGSWQALNADRPPSAVFVGVHNAACEFAKAGRYAAAERLFRILRDRERTITAYGEALFLVSCWQNRHNKEEVLVLLDQSKRLRPEDLREFAPEIVDVVREERPGCG